MVELLPKSSINYFKESRCYQDDNIVWCVYSVFEDNAIPDILGARKQFGDDKTYIGLFHGPLMNAKTDLGYEIDHGASFDIFDGLDAVMLADIHMRQTFNHNGIMLAYVGSCVQQNYGENVSKHGFLLWDVETLTFTEHDVPNENSFYNIKIKSLEDMEKEFAKKLPEKMDDYEVMIGEIAMFDEDGEEAVFYRVDRPVVAMDVDNTTQELIIMSQSQEDVSKIISNGNPK